MTQTSTQEKGQEKQPIIILTHNGLPPGKGGLRTGYLAGGIVFFMGREFRPMPQKKKERELPSFFNFSRSPDADGECPYCGRFPNSGTIEVKTAEKGIVRMLKCGRCDQVFRRYKQG